MEPAGERAHLLTFFVEEPWHSQALRGVIAPRHADRFDSRVAVGVERALELCDRNRARATFFVLGMVAERDPALVRRIVAGGHEVASAGFQPSAPAELGREAFVADLQRARRAIEAATGRAVIGFRSWSWLRPEEGWVFEVLTGLGYVYDASVRSGARALRSQDGRGLIEVPLSLSRSWLRQRPIADGDSLRSRSSGWRQRAIVRWCRSTTAPLVVAVRTWELDPEQPRITALARRWQRAQYRGLERTAAALQHEVASAKWTSIATHLGAEVAVRQPRVAAEAVVGGGLPAAVAAAGLPRAARTSVAIVVPMFDEADNVHYLLRTLARLQQCVGDRYALEFVFVDDCSRDDTWNLLHRACAGRGDVQFVRHERNQGVAAAIASGACAARADIVCTIDADCSYDPIELQRMLPLLQGADVVTASPYHPRGEVHNVPAWRLFLSRGLSVCYRLLLRSDIHTWTSCFRVWRRPVLAALPQRYGGFLGIAEQLVRVVRRGGTVREHPTRLESRLLGHSKMKVARTVLGHLRLLLQTLCGSVR